MNFELAFQVRSSAFTTYFQSQGRKSTDEAFIFMIEKAAPLISESEGIRLEFELRKEWLEPDQRTIIEIRHGILDVFLRIYELVSSIRHSSECENVIKIEANIRNLLILQSTSTEVLKIWRQTIRTSMKYVFDSVYYLSNLKKLADGERKLIDELIQWVKAENSKWDIQISREELAKLHPCQ